MEKCLFMLRLVCYCLLWILSWLIFIPISAVMFKYKGYCLFYADRAEFGSVSVCGYTVTVPVIVSFMYAGYMALAYLCKIALYNKLGYIQETVLEFLVTVIFDGLAWIFMFVNAGLISAGFNTMCWNIFATLEKCSEGVLKHEVFGFDDSFYLRYKIAEACAWLSWFLWLVVFLMGLIATWRAGILPEGENNAFCWGMLPCKPRCTCSCRLQFLRPGNMQGAKAAAKA